MSKNSPTKRSLELLRKQGYTVAITERWNSFAKIRQDLFGFVDLLAIEPDEILAVQTTTANSMSARYKKIRAERRSLQWIEAGGKIVIHGWKKVGSKWECRVMKYPNVKV